MTERRSETDATESTSGGTADSETDATGDAGSTSRARGVQPVDVPAAGETGAPPACHGHDAALEIDPDPALERDAERTARRAMAGEASVLQRASRGLSVQRLDADAELETLAADTDWTDEELRERYDRDQGRGLDPEQALAAVAAVAGRPECDPVGEFTRPDAFYERQGVSPPPDRLRTGDAVRRVDLGTAQSGNLGKSGKVWRYERPDDRLVFGKRTSCGSAAGVAVGTALGEKLGFDPPASHLSVVPADAGGDGRPFVRQRGFHGDVLAEYTTTDSGVGYELRCNFGAGEVDEESLTTQAAGVVLGGDDDPHGENFVVRDDKTARYVDYEGFGTEAFGPRLVEMVVREMRESGLDVTEADVVREATRLAGEADVDELERARDECLAGLRATGDDVDPSVARAYAAIGRQAEERATMVVENVRELQGYDEERAVEQFLP